jgi:hypothetical protein
MPTSTERANDQPPTALPARKRAPALTLACVVVLLVALLGGSLFWMLRSNSGASSGKGGARARATATATVPTWVPTEITPPAEALFYDTFVNNSHGWSLSGTDGLFRILDNVDNKLILADTNPGTTLVESVPTSTNLDNYLISVDFTINQGNASDGTGLYLRGDSILAHDYRVDINGDNTVDVAKESLDANQSEQTTMLLPRQHTSLLNPPGKQNTLTVILLGDSLTVLLNHFALTTITDLSYTSGQVALFARHGNSSGGVTVSYSRVEIDRLASPLATPAPSPILTPTAG